MFISLLVVVYVVLALYFASLHIIESTLLREVILLQLNCSHLLLDKCC